MLVTTVPRWALWSAVGSERPWTVGVEEEVMLLDRADRKLANRVEDVLASLPSGLPGLATAETHACAVELASRPHREVRSTAGDIVRLRRALADALDGLGMSAAIAGTHPSALWDEVEASSGKRYQHIHATMRELAHREPTFALHVHVAVPDGEAAVRALDGLRQQLPLLLALSASSPFWQGRDTGLASARTPIFSMFPRVGIPRHFGTYRAYVRAVDGLITAGAIPDPTFLWWDVRLQPRLGTVEVRIMDGQPRATDSSALAALVQCLVRIYAEGDGPRASLDPEVLAENRFLAARDGMDAWLLAPGWPRRQYAVAQLVDVLEVCRPVAATLACSDELEGIARLADDPGYVRQRRTAAERGLAGVIAGLADEFVLAGPRAADRL